MKPLGKAYTDASASSDAFERLPAGGYICRITAVEDKDEKEYLDVIYDIAEGQYKDFYSDDWGKDHPYAHHVVLSYKDKAFGMFKGRLKAIDASNGTNFAERAAGGLPEQELVGKLVGLVIGYEQYNSDRGEIRERSYVKSVVSTERIKAGDFKIPPLKLLQPSNQIQPAVPEGFTLDESDIPF